MATTKTCPICGTELGAGAMHCTRCLIELAVDAGRDDIHDPAAAALRFSDYETLEEIGTGGMGVVFKARQRSLNRTVALKVIKPGMDSIQVLSRFEAERQALALMDHPNIARVLDAGMTPSGRPYFAMELVEGVPITRFCDEHRLTITQRLELFISVGQAIQHAHQKGIIHRDIKPSNVLVTMSDGKATPKVIDFGIAKAIGQVLTAETFSTQAGAVLGTLEYMSPEQAGLNQADIDTRSDIYALGVLLYELLTGSTPLTRQALTKAAFDEALRRIRQEDTPRPSTRLSEIRGCLASISAQRKLEPARLTNLVRGDLDWIVMKALEKDRNRRYETASGFVSDIQRHLDHEPVVARPPGNLYRFQKFVRRNRLAVISASGITWVLVAGLALSLWSLRREQEARHRAQIAQTGAERSASETRMVLNFFQTKVLAAVRPAGLEGGLGSEVTVYKALDLAEPGISASFTNGPLLEASIRGTLATSYSQLRDYVKATKQQELVVALRKAVLGVGDSDTLAAMRELVRLYLAGGRFHEALPLAEEVLTLARGRLGPEHTNTIEAMKYLAAARIGTGQPKEARPLLEVALKFQKTHLGADDPLTLETMVNLADANVQADLPGDAATLYEDALKLRKVKLGKRHPDTIRTMDKLTSAYWRLGRVPEAKQLSAEALELRQSVAAKEPLSRTEVETPFGDVAHFKEVVEADRNKFGTNHATTLMAMNNLAIVYREFGRLSDAVTLQAETLRLQRATLGPNDRRTLWSFDSLGRAHLAAGDVSNAVQVLKSGLKLWRASFGSDDWDSLAAMQLLAGAYNEDGRPADAEALYREALERARSVAPWHTAEALDGIGESLVHQGKHAEAEEFLNESLAIRKKEHPNEWAAFHTQTLLGAALLGQADYAQAESQLLEGFDGMSARAKQIPNFRPNVLKHAGGWLVELYSKWGKSEKAADWKQKLDQSRKRTVSESSGTAKKPK
jgi:serine/threonine protein kinase/tetratricopeptide (TPR) repeat protein